MKRVLIMIFGLGLLFVFGMSQVLADQQLPFAAKGPAWVIQEAPGGACGAGQIQVEIEGSGQATHMGQYTISRQHCFNPALGQFQGGTFERTAADGDKIFGTYTGQFAAVVEVDDQGNPTVIVIKGTESITGGTGRFTNAEGQGDITGQFNLVTHRGDFTVEGWILY